jgi:hypothetical protein
VVANAPASRLRSIGLFRERGDARQASDIPMASSPLREGDRANPDGVNLLGWITGHGSADTLCRPQSEKAHEATGSISTALGRLNCALPRIT